MLARIWPIGVVALAWIYVFPYSAALNNPNERTRVLQARAIVEHGQLHIGESFRDARGRLRLRDLYGRVSAGPFVNDVALVCADSRRDPPRCAGKIYPAKPPGVTLLGVPGLALARSLGWVPSGPAGEPRVTWILRLVSVIPLMLLGLWIVSGLLRRAGVAPGTGAAVVLATGLGTSAFPYGVAFVGHALAGVALLGGVIALARAIDVRRGWLWAIIAGHATGWAVLLEYHAVAAAACVSLWLLLDARRRRRIAPFAVGALVAMGIHVALHQLMFGHPLKTGHFFLMTLHNRQGQSQGFLGISGVHPAALVDHLLDTYMGLLPLMPWLGLGGAAGAVFLWRERRRLSALWPLALIPLIYLLFVATLGNWRTMNGWSIGPRYLLPAILPLATLAGLGWAWLGRLSSWLEALIRGLAAASIVVIGAITVSFPSPPSSIGNTFGDFAAPLLLQGYGVRNLGLAAGLGAYSLLPFALIAAAAAVYVITPSGRLRGQALLHALAALLVALAYVGCLAHYHPTPAKRREAVIDFAKRYGEGFSPARPTGQTDHL